MMSDWLGGSRRMPQVSVLTENWILDCALGRDHQRLDPFYRRTAWKSGAVRTFELCHHCRTWTEHAYSWQEVLSERGLQTDHQQE